MEQLKAVEVAGIGIIKLNGVRGQNIFDAAKECVFLANMLKIVVDLYWNKQWLRVYRGTTVDQITAASIKVESSSIDTPADCRLY